MDCANGVGGLKLQHMQQRLAAAGLQMQLHATGDGELNGGCGADFGREVPAGFPPEALTQAEARSACLATHQPPDGCSQQAAYGCRCGILHPCVCLHACTLQGRNHPLWKQAHLLPFAGVQALMEMPTALCTSHSQTVGCACLTATGLLSWLHSSSTTWHRTCPRTFHARE